MGLFCYIGAMLYHMGFDTAPVDFLNNVSHEPIRFFV